MSARGESGSQEMGVTQQGQDCWWDEKQGPLPFELGPFPPPVAPRCCRPHSARESIIGDWVWPGALRTFPGLACVRVSSP